MNVNYKHHRQLHSLEGAVAGFKHVARFGPYQSLLDVGAGTGTWMKAAEEAGVADVFGLDGIDATGRDFWCRREKFLVHNLSQPFDLQRRFDCVICLEVGEHLHKSAANTLVSSLCRHADLIFFSAAIPGQFGQNHVNCQWPDYWQSLFNARGFACFDDVRWDMWRDPAIEPWYRQNMFRAVHRPDAAGSEPRISSVVHPWMLSGYVGYYERTEECKWPVTYYLLAPGKALSKKVRRYFSRHLLRHSAPSQGFEGSAE